MYLSEDFINSNKLNRTEIIDCEYHLNDKDFYNEFIDTLKYNQKYNQLINRLMDESINKLSIKELILFMLKNKSSDTFKTYNTFASIYKKKEQWNEV